MHRTATLFDAEVDSKRTIAGEEEPRVTRVATAHERLPAAAVAVAPRATANDDDVAVVAIFIFRVLLVFLVFFSFFSVTRAENEDVCLPGVTRGQRRERLRIREEDALASAPFLTTKASEGARF